MKRLIALTIVAAVILAASPALAFDPQGFNDWETGWRDEKTPFYWARNDIEDAARYEIFQGYGRGTYTFDWSGKKWTKLLAPEFLSEGRITRGEFAAILSRALGLEKFDGPVEGFTDVSGNDWFGKHVASLVSRGIIKPGEYQDSKLSPNDPVTRVEIAVWTARAGRSEGLKDPGTQSAFSDVNPDNKYFREVSTASGLGIIRGFEDGSFKPDELTNRAQAAAVIMRLVRQLNSNPPKEDWKKFFQEAFDATTKFQKDHREPFPDDEVFSKELGGYFVASALKFNAYREGKILDGLGTFLGGGGTLANGFVNLRTRDPRSSYGERTVLSAEPVRAGNRWADVKVTFINQPNTYDFFKLPQGKIADVFQVIFQDGKWKISGMTPIGILEKGFNLK